MNRNEKKSIKCQACLKELPDDHFWPKWTICCKCYRLEKLVEYANNPKSWIIQANDLWNAAMVIQDHQKELNGHMTKDGLRANTMSAPKWLLLGFSFENLFKAIWLKKGNKIMNDNGSLIIPKQFKSHNLIHMAQQISFSLSNEEESLLNVLTHYTKNLGRYPVAEFNENNKEMASSFVSSKRKKYRIWCEDDNDKLFDIKKRCEDLLI